MPRRGTAHLGSLRLPLHGERDKVVRFWWQHQHYDEKNIRRRVYDALNVLMAMDIIGKENKDIFWRGLPSAAVSLADQLQVIKPSSPPPLPDDIE